MDTHARKRGRLQYTKALAFILVLTFILSSSLYLWRRALYQTHRSQEVSALSDPSKSLVLFLFCLDARAPLLHLEMSLTFSCYCLVTKSCPTLCDPMDCGLPGSSVHGILLARILQRGAVSPSRASSQSRIKAMSPALQGDALLLSHQGRPYTRYLLMSTNIDCRVIYSKQQVETTCISVNR